MLKIKLPVLGAIILCVNFSNAQNENEWKSNRPDGHAPISVMGDHVHQKGEIMFSYRLMSMGMNGCLHESDDIDDSEILNSYMAAPHEMSMNMHMLGAMYAPIERLTFLAMANYNSMTMNLQTRMGLNFTTESVGFSDVKIGALVKILNFKKQALHANVMVNIPTGNIDKKGITPMMTMESKRAYPMQLGSGTWDPSAGLTYLRQKENVSFGFQGVYTFRMGENTEGYVLGNHLNATTWLAIKVSNFLSVSASGTYSHFGSITGEDAEMNPMMMPLFNTTNSGKSQFDLGIGANAYIPSGKLKKFRFGAELKMPAYQKVEGIQMRNIWTGILGLQYSIGHK